MPSCARRAPALLTAAALLLLLAACGGNGGSADGTPSGTPPPTATRPSAPQEPTRPTSGGQVADEPVAFMTSDGVTLRGHLYSAPGPRRKILILVSTLPQATWKQYAADFTSRGIALLTFDARGVGETGGTASPARNAADISLAVGFVESRDYPQIYVMGVGEPMAAAAFSAAAVSDLAGVAASPAGANTADELMRISAPKFYIVNEGDGVSEANIKRVVSTAPGPNVYVRVLDPPQTNPDILAAPEAREALLEFLLR